MQSLFTSEVIDPPVPVVVVDEPTRMLCDAFCEIFHRPLPFPATRIIVPNAAVNGSVNVTSAALFAMYPLLAAIEADVPVTSVHGKFVAFALSVNDPPKDTEPPPVMIPVVFIVIELFWSAEFGMLVLDMAREFAPVVSVIPFDPVIVAKAGAAPVAPIKTCPFVPAAVAATAEVPLP